VVVVTGGGGALGRAYATEFARRGASVVVSDIGAAVSGSGSNRRIADEVAEGLVAKGWKAVSDHHNVVTEGEKIIETALREFGGVHVVVNNAGNLRDLTFRNMKQDDFEAVHKVHLLGSFSVTRAAWRHFEKQKYGRILMTTSAAGLYGAYGQTNYASAKLGLVGLAASLAREGAKHNITVNSIAPLAGSRMLARVVGKDEADALKPEYVAAMAVYLCHASCLETGGVFELGGGWFAKLRWERTKGAFIPPAEVSAERVAKEWATVGDFANATHPTSGADAVGPISKNLSRL